MYKLNFRKKIVQEDATIEKKGSKGIRFGKRLGYLFIFKVTTHICPICKKYWDAKAVHWCQKVRVVEFKMFKPSLKASSLECLKKKYVFQFCNNILFYHHTNAFRGKLAIWDFLNLICCKKYQL